ncbi:MAG: hypothetical protein WBR26_02435 [Candidatus Acidiferrum sp.]
MKTPDDVFVASIEEEGNTCDFCGRDDCWPGKDYVCGEVSVGIMTLAPSVWGACGPCAKLIDADDWEGLAQRAAEGVVPEMRSLYLIQMRKTHAAFRRARKQVQ